MPKQQLSGAQKRKAQRAREEAAQVEEHGDVSWSSEVLVEIKKLGPPPISDPLRLTNWQLQISALVTWQLVLNPHFPAALARSILEGVRTSGMVSVKAQERVKLTAASDKLNAGAKDTDHGVKPYQGRRKAPVG